MYLIPVSLAIAVGWWTLAVGDLEIRKAGWLDKLVQYHRQKLLQDVKKETLVPIKAVIKPQPEGYVDSPAWNFTSVVRLMTLIRHSEEAAPVRTALRRMLGPSRRFMSRPQSFKYFPSLSKGAPNDFYYDILSAEMIGDDDEPPEEVDMNAILLISNPVESRLPSAQISVKLIKEILEQRAIAGRVMPTTKRPTIIWEKQSTTPGASTEGGGNGTEDASGASDGGDATTAADGGGNATAAGEEETTPPAEEDPGRRRRNQAW